MSGIFSLLMISDIDIMCNVNIPPAVGSADSREAGTADRTTWIDLNANADQLADSMRRFTAPELRTSSAEPPLTRLPYRVSELG